MKTRLENIGNRANRLILSGVTVIDMDEVASWLSACDIGGSLMRDIARRILGNGEYSFCNIEHRVEVVITSKAVS